MRAPASLLPHRTAAGPTSSSAAPRSTPEQQQTAPVAMAVDSNMVVILASLLCALVCVLGLALVSRCACRRRRSASSSGASSSDLAPKGLKKKAIDALPTVSFFAVSSPESSTSAATAPAVAWCWTSECAICLTEFADGETVRVLPGCGHGFHGACVDAWLRTCASCPSCRAPIVAMESARTHAPAPTVVVVVAAGSRRCGTCGDVAAPGGGGATGGGDCTFLP